jgi:zinc transport system permease protein
MGILAALAGALAVSLGIAASLRWDTPTGPSIVVAASALYAATNLVPIGRRATR